MNTFTTYNLNLFNFRHTFLLVHSLIVLWYYHFSLFIDAGIIILYPFYRGEVEEGAPAEEPTVISQQPTVIPGQDSLIITDDLLSLSLGGPTMSNVPTQQSATGMDLLGDGLDSLVSDDDVFLYVTSIHQDHFLRFRYLMVEKFKSSSIHNILYAL